MTDLSKAASSKKSSLGKVIVTDFIRNRYIYIMAIPMLAYYLLFHYQPMYGAIIAFKNFSPKLGILGSHWIGFQHFQDFFNGVFFERILTNTLSISLLTLLFTFPAPIILALLLNEIRSKAFKRTVQTVSYMPHFISIMVIAGLIIDFTGSQGIVNDLRALLGMDRTSLLLKPEYFRPIYIISEIWQRTGWGSIIYLAALTSIDEQLYEAARIDGAGRLRQTWHITLPGIAPTITIFLILQIGQVMNVGFEKIILLYNSNTYETADVISTFVYRKGILEASYSFSAAVGLFNSVINFILIIISNKISKKVNETSLW